ncbi:Serine/threonine protein kinase [Streptacidiphilus jiangxiensis]|uniref:non-specific serine/threonine protein kinase n=1 Tax=Streptacidiphilus jiangxiensis TaxID=235985 RepID=A0A1H7JTP8_STRJI|nr:Serine/threonine protein kinase [Streptacidiphilus jiangxiensis]
MIAAPDGRRTVGGRYALTALVGQGGMGQVWSAQDLLLGREVAVKLLRASAPGSTHADELRRRFERESRVTARVGHPGLVTVHDAGTDADELYLVMQYVRGTDLADHLAENDPYPWPWAVAVAAQLCPVLAAVHEAGVVHRDLKPRNLMLRHDGTLVALDLGVAAVLGADTTRVTMTGSPVGSPAYMSPEQAMGGAVGPGSDLYSLGAVLYELLTGAVPFEGSSALGTLHRHLHEAPAPLRTVRPDLPPALEALVLWLLAKDPAQRPADATALYHALAPLLPTPTAGTGGAALCDPTRPFRLPFAPWPDRGPGPLPAVPAQPATPVPAPVPPPGTVPSPAVPSQAVPSHDAEGALLAATVDEARRLLGAGRISQALGLLGSALRTAEARHGVDSPVTAALRRQYTALQPHAGANGTAGATPHRP